MKSHHFPYILFSLLLLSSSLFAQQGNNPFELTPRIPTGQGAVEVNSEIDDDTSNPFEVQKGNEVTPAQEEQNEEVTLENATNLTNNPFEIVTKPLISEPTIALPKVNAPADSFIKAPPVTNSRLLNGIIIFVLVLTALLASLFRSNLNKSFQAFSNDNLLGQIYREQSSGISIPYVLFYILFLLNAGIFVFLLLRYFHVNALPVAWSGILGTILVVSGVLLLKLLVLWLMGIIYPVEKETKLYSFTVIIYSIVTGILLIPTNILLTYAPDTVLKYVLYTILTGLGIIYLLRTLRGFLIANRFLLFHKFHFLLYICTVEIAPVIILFKLVS